MYIFVFTFSINIAMPFSMFSFLHFFRGFIDLIIAWKQWILHAWNTSSRSPGFVQFSSKIYYVNVKFLLEAKAYKLNWCGVCLLRASIVLVAGGAGIVVAKE